MADMNMSGFNDYNDTTLFANRSKVDLSDSTILALYDFILYLALALGIPGNILSAARSRRQQELIISLPRSVSHRRPRLPALKSNSAQK